MVDAVSATVGVLWRVLYFFRVQVTTTALVSNVTSLLGVQGVQVLCIWVCYMGWLCVVGWGGRRCVCPWLAPAVSEGQLPLLLYTRDLSVGSMVPILVTDHTESQGTYKAHDAANIEER